MVYLGRDPEGEIQRVKETALGSLQAHWIPTLACTALSLWAIC